MDDNTAKGHQLCERGTADADDTRAQNTRNWLCVAQSRAESKSN